VSLEEPQTTLVRFGIEFLLSNQSNFGNRSKWLKPLNEGLWQLRIGLTVGHAMNFFELQSPLQLTKKKILIRVFYHLLAPDRFLVLSGYDKQLDPSRERQQSEIRAAKQYLEVWINEGEVF